MTIITIIINPLLHLDSIQYSNDAKLYKDGVFEPNKVGQLSWRQLLEYKQGYIADNVFFICCITLIFDKPPLISYLKSSIISLVLHSVYELI